MSAQVERATDLYTVTATVLGKGNGKMNKASTFKAILWMKIRRSMDKSNILCVFQTVLVPSRNTNNPKSHDPYII